METRLAAPADISWAVQVRRVVSQLAPAHRAALDLIYVERLSHRQAAASAQMSERAFAAELSAAMRGFTSALLTE